MNYATIDKELLCVIATLREFRSMLLGTEIHIYTDHKNILNVGDSSERRLRWISYVDEYSPTLHKIPLLTLHFVMGCPRFRQWKQAPDWRTTANRLITGSFLNSSHKASSCGTVRHTGQALLTGVELNLCVAPSLVSNLCL